VIPAPVDAWSLLAQIVQGLKEMEEIKKNPSISAMSVRSRRSPLMVAMASLTRVDGRRNPAAPRVLDSCGSAIDLSDCRANWLRAKRNQFISSAMWMTCGENGWHSE
jgi:hypothetical protein